MLLYNDILNCTMFTEADNTPGRPVLLTHVEYSVWDRCDLSISAY